MKASLNLPHLDDLILADSQFPDKGRIDVLFGAAVYIQIIERTVVKGKGNESIATSSALRWLITGEISMDEPPMVIHLTSLHISRNYILDELLRRFWLQEEASIAPLYTNKAQACENQFVRKQFF